jgi:hypothetical protein
MKHLETTNAPCHFCGQYIELGFELDKEKTRHKAALFCECPDARALQKQHQDEAMAAQHREDTLTNAVTEIQRIFGSTEQDNLEIAMPERVVEHIVLVSVLVYDKVIGKTSMDLPYGSKASISRTLKGNLKIERQDKSATRIEL